MKKLILILLAVGLVIGVGGAGVVFAADCSSTFTSGTKTYKATWECTAAEGGCGAFDSTANKGKCITSGTYASGGTTVTEVTGGAGGNTSRIKAPAECAKIKADFKIDIRTGDAGTQPQEDCQFLKGDVIAMRAMGTDECRFAPNGAKNLCPATMCSRGAGGAPETDGCYLYNPSEFGIVAMLSVVYNITNWIFFILIILSALMIIWGGLQYILAAGDPAKAGKGKTILTLSIIGIAIALLAKVVPSVLKFFLGV